MLAIEGTGSILAADHLDNARSAWMAINPFSQVVDLSIYYGPAIRRFGVFSNISAGVFRSVS